MRGVPPQTRSTTENVATDHPAATLDLRPQPVLAHDQDLTPEIEAVNAIIRIVVDLDLDPDTTISPLSISLQFLTDTPIHSCQIRSCHFR